TARCRHAAKWRRISLDDQMSSVPTATRVVKESCIQAVCDSAIILILMLEVPTKAKFARARDVAYLDTAAEGLPPEDAGEALARYFRDKASGRTGRRHLYHEAAEATCALARLLQTDPNQVALMSSASEALNLLANSIDWKPGDEVLISDLEFPSNVVVWLRLKEKGVRLRVIASENGELRYEQFAAKIN